VERLLASQGLRSSDDDDNNIVIITVLIIRPVLESTHPAIQKVPDALSRGQNGRNVKLSTHLHLTFRLRMREALSPFPPTSFHDIVLRQSECYTFISLAVASKHVRNNAVSVSTSLLLY
jgi:hypothetical protein